MSTVYPESFPVAEITTIVDLVRNGKVKDNLDDAAFAVWVVQGYGQKVLIGAPNGVDDGAGNGEDDGAGNGEDDATPPDFTLSLMKAPADVDEEVALQALEALVSGDPQVQASIPWDIILPYLLKLLTDWLSKQG
jgi:hypothetical protein